jgi:hypothetical protein
MMAGFLDNFPRIRYDINKDEYVKVEQTITNITFRVGIIKSILSNIGTYYEYDVGDETPEILADKFYNDPSLHWIILYANDIYDPQYDWPMNYETFKNYLVNKYRAMAGGSSLSDNQIIAWTQNESPGSNSVHHYEKVIERTESFTDIITTEKYQINKANLTINLASSLQDVPYDIYDNLSETGTYVNIDFGDTTTRERTYRKAVSYYTYENELNDSKRSIKIIKKEYVPQIREEFDNLTGTKLLGLRSLVYDFAKYGIGR